MATFDQMIAAYKAGYTHDEIVDHHVANGMDAPAAPSLQSIWSGQAGGQNELSLDTPEAARTQIDQLANSGLGVGAVEGAVGNTVRSLVQTGTEELTPYMSEADLAVQEVGGVIKDALTAPGVKTGAAIGAGYGTLFPSSPTPDQ